MKKIFSLIVIVLLGFLVLNTNLNKPFYGHHDFNSVYYSTMARNLNRYELSSTKLAQVTNSGQTDPKDFSFHTHHPSILPILLSLSFKLFKFSEWSARLVPLLFSLGSLAMLFLIAKKLKLSSLAAFSSTLIVLTPMFRYFGKLPVHEPLIIFFSLASVLLYLCFTVKPTNKNLTKLLLVAFINGLTGWPGYFLYPLLTLHALIYYKKEFKAVLLTNFSVALAFLVHLFQTYLVSGDFFGGSLIKALLFRLNLNPSASSIVQFSWLKYLVQQARWLTIYYTIGLLVVGLLFLCFALFKILKPKKTSLSVSIILLLLLFALVYPIFFSNAVFIHDYLNIYFAPFLAFSLAWLLDLINQKSFILALILTILIGLGIYYERQPFNQANQKSNMHQTGYQLGKLINQLVPAGESAAIFSINYANHHQVFINFYADRNIIYTGDSQHQWDQFITNDYPDITHAFVVTTNRHPSKITDQALATQSATIKNFGQFNYYQLPKDANLN